MLSFNKKDKNKFIGVKPVPRHAFGEGVTPMSLPENTLATFCQRRITIERQYIPSPRGRGLGRGGSYGKH